jgi:hypothetical protein
MRKPIALCALLLAGLACLAPTTAAAAGSVPTCLVANGGGHGRFTKSLECVELRGQGPVHTGYGRYAPAGPGQHWVTVTVEYRPLGRGSAWLPLATATRRGPGEIAATTRQVRTPRPGTVRACVQVGSAVRFDTRPTGSRFCSAAG